MHAEEKISTQFDPGLNEEQELRAQQLHKESIIIDMLFQGPLGPNDFTDEMVASLQERLSETNDMKDIALTAPLLPIQRALEGNLPDFREKWLGSGITLSNRQVELANQKVFAATFGLAQRQFDSFDWLVKALCADDIRRAKAEGKTAGFISTQLGFGPFPDLETLSAGYDLGLRMLQLTYNTMSTIATGCTERTDGGVSNFGAQVIAEMNKLGMIVDTGHCGRQTTLDACELSGAPVVASHTAAAGLHEHDRCKSDEEIKAIANSGGVIGIAIVPFFLSAKPGADLHTWLEHVRYVADLVGPLHVGIGSDWPMQLPKWALELFNGAVEGAGFHKRHNVDLLMEVAGFDSYCDFINITRVLVSGGFTDDEVRSILGGNFLRVFEAVCG